MIKLIFPPFWSPSQPYLSTPSLAAYLKKMGYEVDQKDFNLEVFESILDVEFLEKCRDKLPLSNEQFINRAEFCIQNVESYKSLIRSQDSLNLESYLRCIAFFHFVSVLFIQLIQKKLLILKAMRVNINGIIVIRYNNASKMRLMTQLHRGLQIA